MLWILFFATLQAYINTILHVFKSLLLNVLLFSKLYIHSTFQTSLVSSCRLFCAILLALQVWNIASFFSTVVEAFSLLGSKLSVHNYASLFYTPLKTCYQPACELDIQNFFIHHLECFKQGSLRTCCWVTELHICHPEHAISVLKEWILKILNHL
jgi:hypothetical protein